MPTIGAPLRKWTAFLLLCSIPTPAFAQSANETATAVVDLDATASLSVTTQRTSTASPHAAPSLRSYVERETACPFRTINYITHTLPQQCLRTSWSAPGETASTNETAAAAEATPNPHKAEPGVGERLQKGPEGDTDIATSLSTPQEERIDSGGNAAAGTEPDAELETDSPFDNANFLSFDEWKKRNLARAGQSPENVGQRRAGSDEQKPHRRPVNVNALDSLGEEAEIDIDFSGFGTPPADPNSGGGASPGSRNEVSKSTGEDDKAAPNSWPLSKDAGKTCKERFNYASFDCAATVLKTNKQAKSSSAVLSEHKDSYMLNKCSADNKFLIVELCDDILVDTVVLANYEFFSSMFRHFRVSVSDRYPVKLDRWRTLATFEARNSRDIQPFLITEPQIWARYLRIEFLTQYGNEFYCPLSLLRVHGTTMLEQFRQDEEEARGVDDEVELIDAAEGDVVEAAENSGPIPVDQVPVPQAEQESSIAKETAATVSAVESTTSSDLNTASTQPGQSSDEPSSAVTHPVVASPSDEPAGAHKSASSPDSASVPSLSQTITSVRDRPESQNGYSSTDSSSATAKAEVSASSSAHSPTDSSVAPPASTVTRKDSATATSVGDIAHTPSGNLPGKASNHTVASPAVHSNSRSSPTQPSPASPTTQESFFKSIHKRLLYLEANSTLSLQYIEEQSRILRDAFIKVEKRQLAKTEKFLDHLNSTVMQELKSYRNMYEQLWQSTIIELESMKERQNTEIGEIGSRISLLADELVWQKRMAVVQSTLLLLCLGLVLFARSGTPGTATADMPIVQQLGTKYSSFFDSPSPRVEFSESGIERRRSTFRSMWRSDTSAGLSDRSHHSDPMASDAESDGARSPVQIEFSPPTPATPGDMSRLDSDMESSPCQIKRTVSSDQEDEAQIPKVDVEMSLEDQSLEDQAQRVQVLETQSGPATPHGTRDSRPSWEEVDRAMDQLKAEEQGQAEVPRDIERKQRRSPLRRVHSSYIESMEESGAGDEHSNNNSGNGVNGVLLAASG
jgi:hypothetical protein